MKREPEKKEPPKPPREDVLVLGCCGAVDCGYWKPVFSREAKEYVMIQGKCYCGYRNEEVKEGSVCPFSKKENKNMLRKSFWED